MRMPRASTVVTMVLALAGALGVVANAHADGLVINASFSGFNSTAQGTIQNAINFYQETFSNAITVGISFAPGSSTSSLGASFSQMAMISYAGYLSDLQSTASTDATDTTALAHLPGSAASPDGFSTIYIKAANAAAIGAYPATTTGGSITFNMGLIAAADGGTCSGANCYSLMGVAEHEIDEILGLGSNAFGTFNPVGGIGAAPFAEDLYRYTSGGALSFSASSTDAAYFSLDGSNDLVQFNNSKTSEDAGDWVTYNPAYVQDAEATPGSTPLLNVNSPEVVALDAVGYNLATPEPPSVWLLGAGVLLLLGMGWRQQRRRGITI